MGSHNELMERKEHYYRAVNVQKATGDGEDGDEPTESKKAGLVSRSSKRSKASSKSKHSDKKEQKDEEEGEDEEEKDLPEIGALRLFSYNKPEFPIMALGAFCAMAYGVVFPLFGYIFAEVLTVSLYPPPPFSPRLVIDQCSHASVLATCPVFTVQAFIYVSHDNI